MKLRLDKYLADMRIGTRTEVKELIRRGCVSLNGEIIKRPEIKVDINCDKISCEGKIVGYTGMEYFMLNKPAGVLTTTEDKRQKTVLDLLDASIRKDVFPVGRLDKDTEGLLLITNDGDLAHKLLSPKKHVPKCYFAIVDGIMTKEDILAFRQGLEIAVYDREENRKAEENKERKQKKNGKKKDRFDAFHAMPAKLTILSINREKNLSKVEIEVCEGKFHQIKRMCETVGKPVIFLKRLSMGELKLDSSLQPGEYRELTEEELYHVKNNL